MATPPSPKAALRATARGVRRELQPTDRREASAAACARLLGLPELRPARVVALYARHGDEIDPAGMILLLEGRGVTTAFPRMRDHELELVVATDLGQLVEGYRGVREPVGPPLDLAAVDAIVAPGVAFDLDGGRLGQGGGHYDRLLAQLSSGCLRIGLCFSCQLVPRVPRDDHDEPVDLVVTEHAVHRTGARRVDNSLA